MKAVQINCVNASSLLLLPMVSRVSNGKRLPNFCENLSLSR